jgi:hypothetical protein
LRGGWLMRSASRRSGPKPAEPSPPTEPDNEGRADTLQSAAPHQRPFRPRSCTLASRFPNCRSTRSASA